MTNNNVGTMDDYLSIERIRKALTPEMVDKARKDIGQHICECGDSWDFWLEDQTLWWDDYIIESYGVPSHLWAKTDDEYAIFKVRVKKVFLEAVFKKFGVKNIDMEYPIELKDLKQ